MNHRQRVFSSLIGPLGLVLVLAPDLGPSPTAAAAQKTKPKPSAAQAYDPCLPAKQIKQMAQDPASIDCLPLKIEVTWDVDERVMRWNGKMDQAKFTLVEDYGAYLLLLYDSGKRKKLMSCMINGPSPEAEPFINANFLKVQGCVLGCREPSANCREYDIPSQELVVTVIKAAVVDEDGFVQCGFGASWDEMGDVSQAGLHTSHLSLDSKQVIPKGYHVRPGLHVVETGNFSLKASGKSALSYDDFAVLCEVGEIVKYFSEKYQSPGSFGGHKADQYAREVKATVRITAGEPEKEHWKVIVHGWSKDASAPPILYTNPFGSPSKLPIAMNFEWTLIGDVVLAKYKKRYSYDSGYVALASCEPSVDMLQKEMFAFLMTLCPGAAGPKTLVGREIQGSVEGQNLRLAWPDFEFRECVECTLLPEIGAGKSKIAPYKQAFSSKTFMPFISGNVLPIRDGAMVKKDWKEFGTSCTITLKKAD